MKKEKIQITDNLIGEIMIKEVEVEEIPIEEQEIIIEEEQPINE